MDSREISKEAKRLSSDLCMDITEWISLQENGEVQLDGVFKIDELKKIIEAMEKINGMIAQR